MGLQACVKAKFPYGELPQNCLSASDALDLPGLLLIADLRGTKPSFWLPLLQVSMEITSEQIRDIITDESNVARELLKDDAALSSLGIASLDVISISFALEDRFGLVLEASELNPASTVGEIVAQIQKSAEAKSPA